MSEKKPTQLEEILDLHDPLPLLQCAHAVIKRRVDGDPSLALEADETDYEHAVLEALTRYLELRKNQDD